MRDKVTLGQHELRPRDGSQARLATWSSKNRISSL